ncbi:hypothetical protein HU200_067532 [Digitaria exilis]|uniref:DNA-directed RNA polymerase n=1 Tax=Digitaria exilis TaxID=1010633 RepID=A0A835DS36_9POAL|nr:hypothetical protein HU200_067532 [Digitaria exilis]
MGSNMQRQAVPLSRSEKCIVGTGLERQTALDSRVSVIAEREGKIISSDSHKIVLSSRGKTISIPLVAHRRSNKNTCMHQKPRVPQGKSIKKRANLSGGSSYSWWRTCSRKKRFSSLYAPGGLQFRRRGIN